MKKIISITIMFCMCIVLLTGCSSKNNLVGTWNGITTFTFEKDGTGTTGLGETVLNKFTYNIAKDKISITYGSDNFVQTDEYFYKIEDGKLYLSTDSSSWLIFEKGDTIKNVEESVDNIERTELSANSLEELLTVVYQSDSFLTGAGSYADWNDEIEYNGEYYSRVHLEEFGINTIDDIYSYISKCYSDSVLNDFKNNYSSNMYIENDGKIYSSAGGLGGLPSHVKFVKASKDGDNYTVTFHYDDPYDYGTGESEQYKTLIFENNHWVFSERCYSNMNDYSDCDLIVE